MDKEPPAYTVAAVDEAIRLLFLVADEPGLGLTELSKRSGNSKARTFRLLTTLENRDLVKRRGENAAYFLSFQALHLGAAAQGQIDLVGCAKAGMVQLGEMFDETVALRVRDGIETVCVARWESRQSLRVHGEIGHRHPLHAGAASRVLLAHAPPEVVDAVLAAPRPRLTPATLVSKAALAETIRRVKESGYAISIGERSADTAAVAVPIRDASAAVIAALSISTPASRMTAEQSQRYLKALRGQALTVSRCLGFRANA